MSHLTSTTHLDKEASFKFDTRSLLIFLLAAIAAYVINIAPQIIFGGPTPNFWIRTTFILIADAVLFFTTLNLLKRNSIQAAALGIDLTKYLYKNVLIGTGIAVATIIIMALVLYVLVPYHFVYKSLNVAYLLKESYSYLLGAFLEELLFRGFLLVFFAKLLGWRLSLLIMALPFGLYHFQGGISLIASTTFFSFVFGLSFVLTGSLLTAVITHATVNVLLHVITGLDGGTNAVYAIVIEKDWPSYPVGLLTGIAGAMIISTILYLTVIRCAKAEKL
nr:type II CAAX endopeptidase family protein [uncultured Mucilaginibacter sp.]